MDINDLTGQAIGAAIEVHITCINLGLLLNFSVMVMKDSIIRIVNELKE